MRIAVIGSGIAGISAAWIAAKAGHEITLYEKNTRAGGHARTVTAQTPYGAVDVDTGFIVFNGRNYPHLMAFFAELGVAYHKSNMSFAASFSDGFEYSSKSLRGMFPSLAALTERKRYGMIREYLRFGKSAKAFLSAPDDRSLGEFMDAYRLSHHFAQRFLFPIGAAIWSCSISTIRLQPAHSFLKFFDNHGLLEYHGQPQWYTVTGGSKRYVDAALKSLGEMGAQLRLGARDLRVTREEDGRICVHNSESQSRYDHVVMAAHADESLAMIDKPSRLERDILSGFRFQPNTAYLHSDPSLMPDKKNCWASWVYREQPRDDGPSSLTITYWMNLLQNLDQRTPLLVTLNPARPPAAELTYDSAHFTHPIFDARAIEAQGRIVEMNGTEGISFVGAWQRHGFHEDGIFSSVRALENIGILPPWAKA